MDKESVCYSHGVHALLSAFAGIKLDVTEATVFKKLCQGSGWEMNYDADADASPTLPLRHDNQPLTVTLCSPVPGCVNRSTWIDASPTGSSPGAGFSDIDTAAKRYSLSTLYKHVIAVTN